MTFSQYVRLFVLVGGVCGLLTFVSYGVWVAMQTPKEALRNRDYFVVLENRYENHYEPPPTKDELDFWRMQDLLNVEDWGKIEREKKERVRK